jgi:hypothetical protein
VGETSRSLFERSLEHHRYAEAFSESSHMVKHWIQEHPAARKRPEFEFSILGVYRDCLSRQVAEALRIFYSDAHLLNSKNEYLANCLTRITVDEDKYERKKRERLEDLKKMEEKNKIEEFRITFKRN